MVFQRIQAGHRRLRQALCCQKNARLMVFVQRHLQLTRTGVDARFVPGIFQRIESRLLVPLLHARKYGAIGRSLIRGINQRKNRRHQHYRDGR